MFTGDPSESRSLFGGRESNEMRTQHKYGSLACRDTKWLTSPEHCARHTLAPSDTLQGISVRYSVPIELLKTVNKLWNHDQLFLRDTLLVPVPNNLSSKQNGNTSHSSKSTGEGSNHTEESQKSRYSPPAILHTRPSGSNSPDDDGALDNLFSRFDKVLASTRESTSKLRSNSNLDFSPQVANATSNLTRSGSTVSIVEPGPHGSRISTGGRTRYKRGARNVYTDDDLPPSSSDEIFLL